MKTSVCLLFTSVALACLGLLLPSLAIAANSPPTNTHEYQLDNGLTVLVRENHQAPVVTVMVWYKVGSIDEPAGETGISHVLEHMMFEGTKNLGPDEFSAIVSRFGGAQNAFTTYGHTAYYQRYAANRLPLALQLEAERMHNLVIDPQRFAKELNVVKEERRMRILDKPSSYAWVRIAAVARPGTGFAHPTIGWLHDLNSLTPAKLMHWYQQYYQPNNAYLVIVGDVDLQQVKHLVQQNFGSLENEGTPHHASGAMQPPKGKRQITLTLPVKVPTLYRTFNVPTLGNAKDKNTFYALSMLAGILGGTASSRLDRELVRGQKVASAVGAGYSGISRGGGLFTFYASPAPGTSLDDLNKALDKQIANIKKHPPSKAEMQRVRAQVLASDVYAKDSNYGQAMSLGRLAVVGLPWQVDSRFADNLAKVTPQEVSQAARKWLVPNRETLAKVVPGNNSDYKGRASKHTSAPALEGGLR